MSAREDALATLAAIASSPESVGETPAHLLAAVDALVAVYLSADTSNMPPRMIASRSNNATWYALYTHVEHRIAQFKRADKIAAGTAA